jgi:hypothetical protein
VSGNSPESGKQNAIPFVLQLSLHAKPAENTAAAGSLLNGSAHYRGELLSIRRIAMIARRLTAGSGTRADD